jgi:hypothetical protein
VVTAPLIAGGIRRWRPEPATGYQLLLAPVAGPAEGVLVDVDASVADVVASTDPVEGLFYAGPAPYSGRPRSLR